MFRLVPTTPGPDARPAADAAPDPDPTPTRSRRARRPAPDRRPGPVTHVLKAPPRPPPPAGQAADLAAQLARLAPVLAEIERAQAFQFLDDRHEADEQRLLERAAALARELKRRGA